MYQELKKHPRLDPIKEPTPEEVAWAAGIFDGEGTVGTEGPKRKSFSVKVSQARADIPVRMRVLFGGSVKCYEHISLSGKPWPCWTWRAGGIRAYNFIEAVRPWLGAKRQNQINRLGIF